MENNQKNIILKSPVSGEIIAMKDVPDELFAAGILGEGVAIIPSEGRIIAPCDGTISVTMISKHAIGVKGPENMDILIHVGLDTVKLAGKYYEYKVEQGDSVSEGDVLMEFDLETLQSEGFQMHTPVLICNAAKFEHIETIAEDRAVAGEDLLCIR